MADFEYLSIEESTDIARKILSSVYRLKPDATPEFVVLNLKGQTSPATLAKKHQKTSTHGLLKVKLRKEIQLWIDQLVFTFKLLRVNGKTLDFTEKGVDFLKSKQNLEAPLKKHIDPIAPTKKGGYKLPQESSGYRMRVRKVDDRFKFKI